MLEGRVQGVGFRATAEGLAQSHPIAGFVRNRWDGAVEIVAEGTAEALDGFQASLRRSHVYRYVTRENLREGEATGEFGGFAIRPTI
jgi:acylphosphatase